MADRDGRGVFQLMDAARTVSALVVVVGHVVDLLVAPGGGWVARLLYGVARFGHAAVIVFFVLSGFWITASVERRRDRAAFWPGYLLDRLSRLWVVLVPALLVGGALDAVGIGVVRAPLYTGALGTDSLHGVTLAGLAPGALLGNLAFLQGIKVATFGSNGPLWSLAFEFWFYVWYPALRLSVRRRRLSPALVALLLAWVYPRLLLGFACWLCGALLFALHRRAVGWSRRIAWPVLLGGLLAATAVLAVVWIDPARRWPDLPLALAFGWLLFGLFLVDPLPSPRVAALARFGARSSFSLYAVHYPVAALLIALLTFGGRWPATPAAAGLVLAVAGVLVALAAGFSAVTEARTGQVREAARRLLRIGGPAAAR